MTGHPIDHIEIPASDLKVVSQFHTEVIGWQIDFSVEGYPKLAAENSPP